MTPALQIIILVILITIVVFLFRKRDKKEPITVDAVKRDLRIQTYETSDSSGPGTYIRKIPRKTYILANLHGKYWGELDEVFSNQFFQAEFYDFHIYEALLSRAKYDRKKPFPIAEDLSIPRDRLPENLEAILQENGKSYNINLLGLKFSNIILDRKLHQKEGNEIFGTIDALVSGYLLDFTEEEYIIPDQGQDSNPDSEVNKPETIINTDHQTFLTGKIETSKSNAYSRSEYYSTIYNTTSWDKWKYRNTSNELDIDGCFSGIIETVLVIMGIAFFLTALPYLLVLLPVFLIIILLNIIPAKVIRWLFGVFAIFFFLGLAAGLFQYSKSHKSPVYIPKRERIEPEEENQRQIIPLIDTVNSNIVLDSAILYERTWLDYDGRIYNGRLSIKSSDYKESKNFKDNLKIGTNSESGYDFLLYQLTRHNPDKLTFLYEMFDSLGYANNLDQVNFSEMVVSFVQDIPYSLILPSDCNPNLYIEDSFINEYLRDSHAKCVGNIKYGIHTPIEFLYTLNGDCDTRTLLLYSIFSHYGYDVAILSSEYYGHSILGLNLPFSGIAYYTQNKRYVLWETTSPNLRAGILPKEISNLYYWRISLKSK